MGLSTGLSAWPDWLLLLSPLLMGVLVGLGQLLRTLFVRHDLQASQRRWPHGMDEAAIEQSVTDLLGGMSLREKVDQLSGDGGLSALVKLGIYVFGLKRFPNMYAGHNPRLGIPPLSFTDGPRGVVVGQATCFPVAMLRGASWDPTLEYRIGQAIGLEARASGANYFAGLCVNLLRHPAWGRAQETYSEDSWHLGSMGLALMQGVQSQHVMVCAKHFAANSIENSRFYVDVRVEAPTLHEVYLPHFRRLVDGGVDSLMSAYNRLNGEYCGHHHGLLTGILREQWGFRGFVSSDWLWGIRATLPAIRAGMDVEMPSARYYGRHLRNAVWRGQVPEAMLDERVRAVLRTKLRWLTRLPDAPAPSPAVIACEAHRALAQESAEQSIVLLENRGVLPWQRAGAPGRVLAVIGELAAQPCLGDHGSSRVSPPASVTFLQGLQDTAGPDRQVVYHDGRDRTAAAALAARATEVLLVVGYQAEDEGENLTSNREPQANPAPPRGGDRASLDLPDGQEDLLTAVCEAQPRTVVALVAGSAVTMARWWQRPGALLYTGYPGMQGGRALARILWGEVNPSGKLPFTLPGDAAWLPPFDRWAETATYGPLHGYVLAEQQGIEPVHPFGFGRSYTAFHCAAPQLQQDCLGPDDTLVVEVKVSNTGSLHGAEVVQCYIRGRPEAGCPVHGFRRLRAFAKVWLAPGETGTVTLSVPVRELAAYDDQTGTWRVLPGEYSLWTGSSSRAADLQEISFRIDA